LQSDDFTISIPTNEQYFDAKMSNYNHSASLLLSAIIREVFNITKMVKKKRKYVEGLLCDHACFRVELLCRFGINAVKILLTARNKILVILNSHLPKRQNC